MKKITILALSALLLTGCGRMDRFSASLTGYATSCIGNVQYIQFSSGASVKYLPNGEIATC